VEARKPLAVGCEDGSISMYQLIFSTVHGQGLTLVHFSAQPKPFWSHLPCTPVS